MKPLALLAVVLFALLFQAGPSDAASPADKFGYGTMKWNGKAAVGRRPLLVVLGDFQDVRFHAPHNAAYYDQLLFGNRRSSSNPSLNAYFTNASGGKFTFVKAGIVGPVRSVPMGSNAADERFHLCAINPRVNGRRMCPQQDASWTWEMHLDGMIQEVSRRRLFNFAPYDRNRDGTVTSDELTILYIGAEPRMVGGRPANPRLQYTCENCGAARDRNFDLPGTRLRYGGKIMSAGEGVGFATLAHELAHTLGTIDVYGAGFRLNGWATLMSGTMGAVDSPFATYLDPWHRMRLGWIEPRVFTFRQEGQAKLVAPQLGGRDTRPILLHSPTKGPNEYFLIEYRTKALGAMDRINWAGGRDRGVLIWHVRTNDDHVLLKIPAPGRPAGQEDRTLVYRGVDGRNKWAYGTGRGYFFEDRVITLRWWDGSDTGMRVRVGPIHARQPHAYVDWGFRRTLRPKFTTRSIDVSIGQRFHLDGKFGIRQDQSFQLLDSAGRKIPLPIDTWTPTRIMTSIPSSVAAGRYRLVAYADRSLRAHDLGITANIRVRQAPLNPTPRPVRRGPIPRFPGR